MPIGKNAIKRVKNNGYSSVQTSAPDMENSEVIKVDEPTPVAEPEQKKPTKKTVKAPCEQLISHIAIGDPLPIYLL